MSKIDNERTVGGIVLCGGKSSRMGQPKHLLPFGDEVMLQRIVRIVSTVVSPVVVVAAADQDLPGLPDHVTVARDQETHLGPLAGLLRGLEAIDESVDAVYLTGCDVPLLQPQFIAGVISLLEDHEAVVPAEESFFHPLAAVYRTSLQPAAKQLIAQNVLRPRALIEGCNARTVTLEQLKPFDPALASLCNMNSPEEYEELHQRCFNKAPH